MAQEQQADEILAYMRLMIERANTAKVSVRKRTLPISAHISSYFRVSRTGSNASPNMVAPKGSRSSTSSSRQGCAR